MSNFILTGNIVLPIFLLMVVGFAVRRLNLADDKSFRAMNKLVFKVFLPCSLCKSIMNCDKSMAVNWQLMVYTVAAELVIFGLCFALVPRFVKDDRQKGVIMQAIFRGNYAIFGLPLAEALFPQGDGGVAAMMVIATVPVYNMLAVITLEYYSGGKCGPAKMLKGLVQNPLLWGCAIGFLLLELPFSLPAFAISTINKLGTIAGPLALVVLGASINPGKFRGNGVKLCATTFIRLIVVPVAALIPAYMMGFRGPEFAALMIAFATPTATSSFTMAVEMGSDGDLAAQLVMTTSTFAVVSIFLIIFGCKSLGVF